MHLTMQTRKQINTKIGLQKRFSPRKGHTAARSIENRFVAKQAIGKFLALPFLACHADEILGTDVETSSEGLTLGMLAGSLAKTAIHASRLTNVQFAFPMQAFGIMAPYAP